ncbi:hypothetical protein DPMN_025790 [Dreissena polymorpha]|uniref:Cadherin domain-containing protein n=1 Tax=Dreissena polymorpha TaxID=45954 RepID=A0A9D4RDY8_DREPO|nr:hypothetical protein DPMN_025790 [Dreissena polymorpha]
MHIPQISLTNIINISPLYLQLTIRARDGSVAALEASAQVTVTVNRNFFSPELTAAHPAAVSSNVPETAEQGSLVYSLNVVDRDRRVCETQKMHTIGTLLVKFLFLIVNIDFYDKLH